MHARFRRLELVHTTATRIFSQSEFGSKSVKSCHAELISIGVGVTGIVWEGWGIRLFEGGVH